MTESILVPCNLLFRAAKAISKHHNSLAWEISKEISILLAQPASEPKPVCYWMHSENQLPEEGFSTASDFHPSDVRDHRGELWKHFPLFAHPAPTGVVQLPEPLSGGSDQYDDGWNACLDAVEKLNGAPK
jgi:hypothetical protein